MKHHILEDVCQIALRAGDEIMRIYNEFSDFSVESKKDKSPLTIADKASNNIINDGLKNLSLQYPIISEENKQIPYEKRKAYDIFWLVDPLDGTKEFIKKNGEFTVNIALMQDGYPVMGVVYAPARESLYYSAKGEGAFKKKNGKTKKIHCNRINLYDKGLRVVCSRSHINEDTKDVIDRLNEPELVAVGSSLKLVIIAEGEADYYPRLGPTMEWDIGAAQAILEEAGGSVVSASSNKRLNYNKESLLNPYFIALAASENGVIVP